MLVLGGRHAEFFQHFVNMSGAMPVAMKTATTREEECRTAAAVEFLGMPGKVTERDPRMAVAIGDRQNACWAVDRSIRGLIGERQQPSVARHEIGRMAPIGFDLLSRSACIKWAEQRDQCVSREARGIDLASSLAAEFDIGDAVFEFDRRHCPILPMSSGHDIP